MKIDKISHKILTLFGFKRKQYLNAPLKGRYAGLGVGYMMQFVVEAY